MKRYKEKGLHDYLQASAKIKLVKLAYGFSFDLSTVTALNNQAYVYFLLIDRSTTAVNGGTGSTFGTSSVDNFTVTGVSAVPGAAWLMGTGLIGLLGLKQRANGINFTKLV